MSREKAAEFAVHRTFVHILMGTILVLLISFALWLIWLTYFRVYFDTGLDAGGQRESPRGAMATQGQLRHRFHNVVNPSMKVSNALSFCRRCHNDMPHAKSREKRAFLNAHAYFMACEVCHVDYRIGSKELFRWADTTTGKLHKKPPEQGGSRITPAMFINGGVQALEITYDEDRLEEYLRSRETMDKVRQKATLDGMHKAMKSDAVSCKDCHTMQKQPFLTFSQLGYSKGRIDELRRMEVTGMVKKYERFYLPNLTRDSGG